MTLLKIFSLGDVKEEDAFVLSEGQHVIGRGVLNCYDKRISRKHALIKICNNTVTIKAIHVNPCFFKSANGSNVMILPKDASVVLNQGDQFAFLASFFWFKVKVIKDDKRVDFTSEIVQDVAIKNNIDHHSHKVEAINSVDVDINYISSRVKRSHNDENLITKRRKISCKNINSTKQINTSSDELIRPSTSVNYSFYTPPKVKTESLAQTIVEDYVNQNDTNVSQEIKEGSSCTENGKGCSFTTKTEILDNIKIESNSIKANDLGVNNHVLENDDIGKGTTNDHIQKIPSGETSCTKNKNTAPSSMNNGNKNYKRPRCWYGYSCYRQRKDRERAALQGHAFWLQNDRDMETKNKAYEGKNLVHRADFRHPGDDDYDTDPDDDRPLCPFGGACYRKNLNHQKHYRHSHPPLNNFDTSGNQNPPKKHAKANNSENNENEDEDKTSNSNPRRKASMNTSFDNVKDDYEDPFVDDATSDEFELSSSDDDSDSTDWEDSEKVDENSQEIMRLIKEAKKFTKIKPKKD